MEITIVVDTNMWHLLWNVLRFCSLSLMKMFNNTELFMGSELPYMLTLPKYSTISNSNTHCSYSDWIKVKTFNCPASSGTLEPSLSEQPGRNWCWICGSQLVGLDCFLLRLLHARRLNIKNLSSVKCFFAVGTSLTVGEGKSLKWSARFQKEETAEQQNDAMLNNAPVPKCARPCGHSGWIFNVCIVCGWRGHTC